MNLRTLSVDGHGISRAITTALTRAAEGITVWTGWNKPAMKASSHVSGDHLAGWRFDGMPLPNIWRTPEGGSNDDSAHDC